MVQGDGRSKREQHPERARVELDASLLDHKGGGDASSSAFATRLEGGK